MGLEYHQNNKQGRLELQTKEGRQNRLTSLEKTATLLEVKTQQLLNRLERTLQQGNMQKHCKIVRNLRQTNLSCLTPSVCNSSLTLD